MFGVKPRRGPAGGRSCGFRREKNPFHRRHAQFAFTVELMFASLGLSPQEGRRDFLLVGCVSMFIKHAKFIKNAFYVVSRQADGREMTTEI